MKSTLIPENKFLPHLLGLSVLVAFLLPHTNAVMMLVNPILCVLLIIANKGRISYKKWPIVVIPIVISFIFCSTQGITLKAFERVAVIILYFVCFPFVTKVKLPNYYLYICLGVIIISQLAYLLGIPFITSFLDTYYPIPEEMEKTIGYIQRGVTRDNIMNYRLGGLYRGVNPCARFLNMLMAIYIINNSNRKFSSLLPFLITNFLGVVLTGSRTGFVVGALLGISFVYVTDSISKRLRYVLVALGSALFVSLLFSDNSTYRAFRVFEGFNDSASEKSTIFTTYLSNETSVISLLFGHFDNKGTFFDSDYGDIIYSFGFIGFFAILFYFYKLYKRTNKIGRIFYLMLLWMYSATIIMSFRPIFAFMLLLSLVYSTQSKTQMTLRENN